MIIDLMNHWILGYGVLSNKTTTWRIPKEVQKGTAFSGPEPALVFLDDVLVFVLDLCRQYHLFLGMTDMAFR